MRKVLILVVLALCAAPTLAASDSASCDAKPFTLNKPAAETKKPVDQTKLAQASSKTAKPNPKPKAKPPLLAPCKSPKSKKG